MSPRMLRSQIAVWVLLLTLGGCGDPDDPVAPVTDPDPAEPSPAVQVEVIHVGDSEGDGAVALVDGSRPAWSPDGRQIAFHRLRGSVDSPRERIRVGDIYVVGVDGSDETLLARGIEPAWSPDGRRIAFTNADGIAVTKVGGGDVTTLLPHDFRDDTNRASDRGVGKPAWSPDGEHLAFEHRGDEDGVPSQIFVMNSDGSGVRRVTPTSGPKYVESDPAWSPDGSRIAFWTYIRGIVTAAATGGRPSGLYGRYAFLGFGTKPAWSPDGTAVAFTLTGVPANCVERTCETWVVDATGGAPRSLLADGHHAVWSPDGERLAFVVSEER